MKLASNNFTPERFTITLPSGQSIAYYTAVGGESDSVLLLHGGGTDHALLSWRDTIPALAAAGLHVIAPDQPGYGHSPLPPLPVTMDLLVHSFAELVDALALERFSLVGVSMGGAVSIGYALAHPSRVKRMTLVGSYGLQDRSPVHTLSYFLVRTPLLATLSNRLIRTNRWLLRQTVKQIIHNPASLTPELVDEVGRALEHEPSQRAFAQWQRDEIRWGHTRTNYTDRLHEIEQPTLLVHGSKDIGVPVSAVERAARRLPNAQLELFDGAGHWTQRDEPQRFNRLLLDFLAQSVR